MGSPTCSRPTTIRLPKAWRRSSVQVIQGITDQTSKEINSDEIWNAFETEYVTQPEGRFHLESFEAAERAGSNKVVRITAEVTDGGVAKTVTAEGNGPVNAFSIAMRDTFGAG